MRKLLEDMFRVAIDAADPAVIVPQHLPQVPVGRTIVIGAGKAAASMARAFETAWEGEVSGLVVTRYGHGAPCRRIEVVEASHPVPDAAGQAAAGRILGAVQGLSADDLVVCLISGGGSALLSWPAPGLTLADKQEINRALLKSGAPISEMNVVRKHLSAIKGGRLAAAAWPARVVTLLISDVPGDDPSVVASGPTVADASSSAQALEILTRYAINEPRAAIDVLHRSESETPKPGDARFAGNEVRIIATARKSVEAAAALAKSRGFEPFIVGDAIEGEARDVGTEHARLALEVAAGRGPLKTPCVLLSGGETTVTVRGGGRGGRNVEYLLALAIALDGAKGIYAIAGDTDGIDGSEMNAGAMVWPDSLPRAENAGLSPRALLRNNDAFTMFETIGGLVMTGPTLTNVNDFRAIVIE